VIGCIASLRQHGKQVGGILNWSIDGRFESGRMGMCAAPKVFKSVKANSYWLISEPNSDIFEVDFYQQINNQLVLMDTGKVKVGLPDTTTLNRILSAPLTLRWIWDD